MLLSFFKSTQNSTPISPSLGKRRGIKGDELKNLLFSKQL
jgi:hypothetical protein